MANKSWEINPVRYWQEIYSFKYNTFNIFPYIAYKPVNECLIQNGLTWLKKGVENVGKQLRNNKQNILASS